MSESSMKKQRSPHLSFWIIVFIILAGICLLYLPQFSAHCSYGMERFFQVTVTNEDGTPIKDAILKPKWRRRGTLREPSWLDVSNHGNTYIIWFNHLHTVSKIRTYMPTIKPDAIVFSIEKKGFQSVSVEYSIAELERNYLVQSETIGFPIPITDKDARKYRLPDMVLKKVE